LGTKRDKLVNTSFTGIVALNLFDLTSLTGATFAISFVASNTAANVGSFSVGTQGVAITFICLGACTFIYIWNNMNIIISAYFEDMLLDTWNTRNVNKLFFKK